jgi:hypothetical protein
MVIISCTIACASRLRHAFSQAYTSSFLIAAPLERTTDVPPAPSVLVCRCRPRLYVSRPGLLAPKPEETSARLTWLVVVDPCRGRLRWRSCCRYDTTCLRSMVIGWLAGCSFISMGRTRRAWEHGACMKAIEFGRIAGIASRQRLSTGTEVLLTLFPQMRL